MELKEIKMIGSKSLKLLNNMNIYNINDLIRNYPYKFDVLIRRDINDIKYFDNMIIDGTVETLPIVSYFKGRMNRLSFFINTQNKIIKVIIFNRAFLKNNIKIGNYITIMGKFDEKTNTLTANNIMLAKLPNNPLIIPIYHLTKGITNKQMNLFINNALLVNKINNNIPDILMQKYDFMDEYQALKLINNPVDNHSLKEALKVLKYEELYTYMYKVLMLRKKNQEHNTLYKRNININKIDEIVHSLSFELTQDQNKVIKECLNDMQNDIRMNRLLQGDVGSGKTIVAFILAYASFTAGFQSALMAPTEILAKQHYDNAVNVFKNTDFKIALLTGKTSLKDKKDIYKRLENNEIDFIIGTHALISDNVKYNNLGLVVTDEQHRFGVNQRLSFMNKGVAPDILLMSATPIPRTYALTLYGDTDISSIKTMPKGRLPIETHVLKKDDIKEVLNTIYTALKNGNQAYVIAPMIEENDTTDYTNVYDLKHKFELAFKNYNVAVLHGKMEKEEKDNLIADFLNNKINLLISTTIIEVGVDVKNATVMTIFDADKFGLSTLHQLRGRVGRNNLKSFCYLISDKDKDRLKIMEQTTDGYKISEADFKLRGQGDLFGNRQSGDLIFKLSDIKKDYDLLIKVRDDVNDLWANTK